MPAIRPVTEVKPAPARRPEHGLMRHRVIPILPESEALVPWVPPRLLGDADTVERVLAALQDNVRDAAGHPLPVQRWLRELRVEAGEACIAVAPRLGHAGAGMVFDTLRRELPDTDIYIAAAPA